MLQHRRYLIVFVGMFLLGWMSTSGAQLWRLRHSPLESCRTSLRIIYLAAKGLEVGDSQSAVPLNQVKRKLREGFRLTEEDDKYLFEGRQGRRGGSVIMSQQISLLCPSDPDFAVKTVMIKSPVLDFEPSYRWCPDDRTLAYCPHHHHALLKNGTIERR